jgi:hypothetical protein
MSGVLKRDRNGQVLQAFVPGVSQNVAIGAASVQSAAFGELTTCVRVVSTSDCFIAIGQNPTATTSSMLLPAGAPEYLAVDAGMKVAVIQQSAAGSLNVTELG